MSDKGDLTTVPCVRFTRVLPGPIEKVWAHLTDTRLLPTWFGPDSRIEPRQGGAVHLAGGHIRGTVTQWQPPMKLVYTWNVFSPDDGPDAVSAYPESYPTFELETRGDEVVLTFAHFPVIDRFVPQNAMGWHTMLDILADTLHGRAVAERACMRSAMRRSTAWISPNLQGETFRRGCAATGAKLSPPHPEEPRAQRAASRRMRWPWFPSAGPMVRDGRTARGLLTMRRREVPKLRFRRRRYRTDPSDARRMPNGRV